MISITDLNSTNGTVVNGDELTPMDTAEISAGSEIIFGECLVQLSGTELSGAEIMPFISRLVTSICQSLVA
jgi:pSer/pThr/pTyr-binding forkhead associated (FHA) protein